MRNLFKEMFKFQKRSFDPIVPPMRYTLLYAVQSKYYLPSGDLIKSYSKMHSEECEALWKICHSPSSTTVEDIDMIFFERRGYDKSRPMRYYIKNAQGNPEMYAAGPLTSSLDDPTNSNPLNSPYDNIQSSVASFRASGSSISSSSAETEAKELFTDDFLQFLPSSSIAADDGTTNQGCKPASYFIDKKGSDGVDVAEFACPDTFEEMMFLVKTAREGRNDIMQDFEIAAEPLELREKRCSSYTYEYRFGCFVASSRIVASRVVQLEVCVLKRA
jgi:hypothetical protein